MQVIVNDLAITYSKNGQGPVVVLLHGWGDTKETFAALTQELEKRFTVVALDLPGFGGSQAPHEAWGPEEYAVCVRDALLKIAIGSDTISVLVGHSNGGAIAVTAVARQLLSPRSLVLIASAGIRNSEQTKKSMYTVGAKVGKVASLLLPKHKRQAMRQTYYQKIGSDMLVVPHMEATFKRIIKHDIVKDAEKISIPTLLVYGELDSATPVSMGMALHHAIVESQFRVVQGGDHFIHQNHTDEVLQYMKEFLS